MRTWRQRALCRVGEGVDQHHVGSRQPLLGLDECAGDFVDRELVRVGRPEVVDVQHMLSPGMDPLAVNSGSAVGAFVGLTGVGAGSLVTPLMHRRHEEEVSPPAPGHQDRHLLV